MTGGADGRITRDEEPRRFAMVPDALISDLTVSAEAVRLWAKLDRYAGASDRAFPRRELLAADLGCSVSTIKRLYGQLIGAGWITRKQQTGNVWDTHLNRRPRKTPNIPDTRRSEDEGGSPVSRPKTASRVTGDPAAGSLVTRPKERESLNESSLSAHADEMTLPGINDPASFEAFVEAYAPKGHIRRSAAKPVRVAWSKAILKAPGQLIVEQAAAYRAFRQTEEARGESPKYQKQATTWLNEEQWLTDYAPAVIPQAPQTAQDFWSQQ